MKTTTIIEARQNTEVCNFNILLSITENEEEQPIYFQGFGVKVDKLSPTNPILLEVLEIISKDASNKTGKQYDEILKQAKENIIFK